MARTKAGPTRYPGEKIKGLQEALAKEKILSNTLKLRIRKTKDLEEALLKEKVRTNTLKRRLMKMYQFLHSKKLCSCYPAANEVPQLCPAINVTVQR